MRAAVVADHGGPEQIRIERVDLPSVGQRDVLVRVHAAALNFRDVKQRREPALESDAPYVTGSDFAGEVVEMGAGVTGIEIGDRVVGVAPSGACAEFAVTHALMLAGVPDELDLVTAATIPVSGLSASCLLSASGIAPEAVAVTYAAAGGLGCYLGGLLRTAGVRSIGLTSTPEKAQIASQAGHADVILYRDADPVEAVLELTAGRGADVVFDSVAGAAFTRSFQMLADDGTVMLCGRSAGEPDLASTQSELIDVRRNRGLRDFFLSTYLIDHIDEIPRRVDALARGLLDGTISVPITTFALDAITAAHDRLERGTTVGKLVVVP